jgi:outer membrane protein
MKKMCYLIFAVALDFLTLPALYAQGEKPVAAEKKALRFDTYLEEISAYLPEIKSNEINILTAENAVKQAKSSGDVSLNGSGKYSSTNQSMLPMSAQKYTVNEMDYSIGASKRITSTCTDVSASFDYAKNDYSGSISASSFVPSASIKISQPLLYNFIGKVDRYAEKNAKMKADIARIQSIENNKCILNAYKKLYFQWQVNIKILEDIEVSIKNSKILRDQVARNVQAGLSEDDDYQRAAASVLSYENQHIEYSTSLKNIEHQLSLYIDSAHTVPDEKEFDYYFSIANENGYDYISFDKTNSYRIIDLSLKNLDYAQGVYENKLLPTLNAYAGITRKNITASSTDAFAKLPDTDYNMGFEFSYKLGNNSAESDIEGVKIQIQSLKYEYDKTQNDYKKSLLKTQESVNGTKNQIKTNTAILHSLRLRFATEKKKYSQGRLGLSYLIDTQNSISSYNTSFLNFKYQLISYYLDYMDATK